MAEVIDLKWKVSLPQLGQQIGEREERLLMALDKLGRVIIAKLVTDAKTNAPWTDRTANARQTLYGRALLTTSFLHFILGHGVDYGYWLEVKYGGKWGIIVKTINVNFPKIMAMIRQLFGAG